jgi:hypothetical protein
MRPPSSPTREVGSLVGDPDRLLSLADDYLGQPSVEKEPVVDATTIARKIENLEMARITRVSEALKAGMDAELLRSAVVELDSELDPWRRRFEQIRIWAEWARLQKDRYTQVQEMALMASDRLRTMSQQEQRVVIEALELKVQILGWKPCAVCGGSGKGRGGTGGVSCSMCRMVKVIPLLRIDGIWSSDFDLDRGEHLMEGVNPPVG